MSKHVFFHVGIPCLCVGLAVLTANAADPVTQQFEKYDKNKDGIVTSGELPQPILFRLLDGNGDGKITLDEAHENAPRIMAATQSSDMKGSGGRTREKKKEVASAAKKTAPEKPAVKKDEANSEEAKPAAVAIRQGPKYLKPAEHKVGIRTADAEYATISGKTGKISDCKGHKYTVYALTSTSCPLSKKYLPTLSEVAQKYATPEVAFVLVNPFSTDKPDAMKAAADSLKGKAEYVHDKSNDLARTLGAVTTTDVLILDAAQTVVYHGAVDDQYGLGYSLEKPKETLLIDALEELLKGDPPRIAATEAPGCTLELAPGKPASTASGVPTYHNQIARIVQQNCVECHREGGVAPFKLTSFQEVVDHASMIKTVVEKKTMPPWFAVEKEKSLTAHWANDRSLSDEEKQTLNAWLNGGKPEGNAKEAPVPFQTKGDWIIGKPDVTFELPEAVEVKATGVMPYYDAVVETKLTEDKWVQALEVRPTAREVVHHVIVFVLSPNQKGERQSDERLGYFAVYVPGNSTLIYPDGFAKRLPKGSRLRFQMHYTPNGTAAKDQTKVGFVYAKQPPEHEVLVTSLVNTWFNIPPGDADFHDSATIRLPTDIRVLGYLPHMHLRGKAAKYEILEADGTTKTLLDVPNYDFNWQLVYRYADPPLLTKGTRMRYTSWFDNSEKNPANPDAKKGVKWGPQTTDEMLLGYMEYYIPNQKPTAKTEQLATNLMSPSNPDYLFDMVDADGDEKLSKDEMKRFAELSGRGGNDQVLGFLLATMDANKDGLLDRKEFAKVKSLGRPKMRRK